MKNHSTPKRTKAVKHSYPEDHYMDFLVEQKFMEKKDGRHSPIDCKYSLAYLNALYKKTYL
jgi:hypothetical protein